MRYKGRRSEETLAGDHPHVVEIVVPLGGFGRQLDRMHEHLRGIAHVQGRGQRDGESDITRWLFARREDAQKFAQAFGGTVIE